MEATMSGTDRLKNQAQKLAGKAKEAGGKISGKPMTRDKGKGTQVKADLKNAGESVKKASKH
jgi:uncharacterized protein YjbJ (UPF0337 family)